MTGFGSICFRCADVGSIGFGRANGTGETSCNEGSCRYGEVACLIDKGYLASMRKPKHAARSVRKWERMKPVRNACPTKVPMQYQDDLFSIPRIYRLPYRWRARNRLNRNRSAVLAVAAMGRRR